MKVLFTSKNFEPRHDLRTCDPEGLVLMVDLDRCIACGTCAVACAVAHGSNGTGAFESARPIAVRDRENKLISLIFLPCSCRHCGTPCSYFDSYNFWINCPNLSLKEEAIGKGELKECDCCAERIREGLWPACATRCAMKAIYFGRAADVAFAQGEKTLRGMGNVVFNG